MNCSGFIGDLTLPLPLSLLVSITQLVVSKQQH